MQPHVKHIDTYIRTAIWFTSMAGNDGSGREYAPEEREGFRKDIPGLVKHAKYLENEMNSLWGVFFEGSESQLGAQEMFRNRMAEHIKDKRLLDGITPKFSLGCRRITPGMFDVPLSFLKIPFNKKQATPT